MSDLSPVQKGIETPLELCDDDAELSDLSPVQKGIETESAVRPVVACGQT